MNDLQPELARALGNTLLDLLPDYELGRMGVAQQAEVNPQFVERLYDPNVPVDPAEVTKLAKFLGIDIDRWLRHAKRAGG